MKKTPEKRLKIMVGTNSLSESQYPAYTNHIQFWYSLGRYFPHIEFVLCNPSRMSIDNMRNMAGHAALQAGCDGLLFLDDDVLIHNPVDAFRKLLAMDVDIACAPVCVRSYPFDFMVFKQRPKSPTILDRMTKLPKNKVIDIDAAGFSFCLIKTSLLKKVDAPWFLTTENTTEDIYFCLLARKVDPFCTMACDTSIRAGHILWPEIIDIQNREAYAEYFRKVNTFIVNGKQVKK